MKDCSFFHSGYESIRVSGPKNLRITGNYLSRQQGTAVMVYRGVDTVIEDNLAVTMFRHNDEVVRIPTDIYWPRAMF